MKCQYCGAENPQGLNTCQVCGSELIFKQNSNSELEQAKKVDYERISKKNEEHKKNIENRNEFIKSFIFNLAIPVALIGLSLFSCSRGNTYGANLGETYGTGFILFVAFLIYVWIKFFIF